MLKMLTGRVIELNVTVMYVSPVNDLKLCLLALRGIPSVQYISDSLSLRFH
jgi:hypothetical protein